MTDVKIIEAVKRAREGAERKFKQTFDLAVNLKNMDMKKPENKIKADVILPNKFRQETIGIFADNLVPAAKALENVFLIKKEEIDRYMGDKKAARKLAKACNAFIAEAQLMPAIGKALGQTLAPKNKMPKPVPATLPDLRPVIENLSKTVSIALKDNPVIHCAIGKEEMEDLKVAENIETVLKAVVSKLPKGKDQVKNAYVKLTMGKPVKIEVK